MQRPPRSTHTDTRFPYTTRFRCGRRGRTRRPRSFPEEAQPQVGVVHEHAVDPALGGHRPLAGVVAERPRAPAPPELREKERVLGPAGPGDRKSVVEGKSVSVRVDLGGSRIIKKKTQSTKASLRVGESANDTASHTTIAT